jgi:Flp pilus assembly protein CpaB
MRSRMMTLALALALAGVAVTLVVMYVQRVEEESTAGQKTRPVLVATRSLSAGTTAGVILDQRAFELRDIPVRYVQPGALTAADNLERSGLTLADDVTAGEQLTSLRFQASEQSAFLSQFPENTEALSLPLDYVRGVSGHLKVGDEVNAFVTGKISKLRINLDIDTDAAGLPTGIKMSAKGDNTFLLLRNLPVMEVLPESDDGKSPSAMTLAVTTKEAAALINAQETARLWFTLVPADGGGS